MSAQRQRSSYSSGKRTAGRKRGRGRKRKVNRKALLIRIAVAVVLMVVLILLLRQPMIDHGLLSANDSNATGKRYDMEQWPELNVDLIDVNPYSRPGIELEKINGIVIHYTANPGSTAKQNRDYFADLANTHTTKASSHFVISTDGEIVQCIPCNEIAYCSNDRNSDTISIECCHPDESGKFNKETYDSLVELVSWLVCRYDLDVDDVIRHYDVTGKICPKYFVDHPDEWDEFKEDVNAYILKYGTKV